MVSLNAVYPVTLLVVAVICVDVNDFNLTLSLNVVIPDIFSVEIIDILLIIETPDTFIFCVNIGETVFKLLNTVLVL